jgi:hypothetical protein
MKRLLYSIACSLLFLTFVFAQSVFSSDKFSDFAASNWQQGNKAQLLEVAQNRLQSDPNDLSSLLICFEYGSNFMDLPLLGSILPKIRNASEKVQTPNYDQQRKLVEDIVEVTERMLPSITEEMAKAEAHKGEFSKPLSFTPVISALEEDGLVAPVTPQERELVASSLATATFGTKEIVQAPTNSAASPTPEQETKLESAGKTPSPTVLDPMPTPTGFPLVPMVIVGTVIAGIVLYLIRRKSK